MWLLRDALLLALFVGAVVYARRHPLEPLIPHLYSKNEVGMAIIRLSTKDPAAVVEREPLFEVDDVMYDIPAQVPANETVKYLTDLRTGAHDIALSRLLDRMVGKAGMDALANCPSLTAQDLKQLMDIIGEKVLGSLEEVQPKGN